MKEMKTSTGIILTVNRYSPEDSRVGVLLMRPAVEFMPTVLLIQDELQGEAVTLDISDLDVLIASLQALKEKESL